MYKPIDLGISGECFLTDRLQNGGALGLEVSLHSKFERCFTIGDEAVKVERLIDFDRSPGMQMQASLEWLQSNARCLATKFGTYSIILEDPWLLPSDISERHAGHANFASINNSVCFAFGRDQVEACSLLHLTRNMASFEFNGFLIGGNTDVVTQRIVLDGELIINASSLVESVIATFVTAYDRDGLVIGLRSL